MKQCDSLAYWTHEREEGEGSREMRERERGRQEIGRAHV